MKTPIAGLLAGCVATIPMSALMRVFHQQLPARESYPLPPEQITEEIAERAGLDSLERSELRAATVASHLAYGAGAGLIYGWLQNRVKAPPLVKGVAFGLALWTMSYLGWLPLAKVLPSATEHSARRNALMIAAHVVWGAATGALFQAWNDETDA